MCEQTQKVKMMIYYYMDLVYLVHLFLLRIKTASCKTSLYYNLTKIEGVFRENSTK